MPVNDGKLSRAQGCLLGQLTGDALGSLVEFLSPNEILREYPNGVRELADGGTWGTIAGQPTDDSEMALMLARTLIKYNRYDPKEVRKAYVFWLNTVPFDCGNTVSSGLHGRLDRTSQANGALMRISPLGVFGCNFDLKRVSECAQADAAITHPHPICLQANALFTMAIASTVRTRKNSREIYEQIKRWAVDMKVEDPLMKAIVDSSTSPPADYLALQGWVLIGFQNALWQLLHAATLENGVVDTVMRGGDTDTNGAITRALLGAAHGLDAIPEQWREKVLNCRPEKTNPRVRHPRPECLWPVDALDLAAELVRVGATVLEPTITI